jgi:hypothetical protein
MQQLDQTMYAATGLATVLLVSVQNLKQAESSE